MKPTLLTMVVVLVALVGAPSATAGDTRCVRTTLTATYDNIIVPAGAWCDLMGARVRGNVLVGTGASLSILRAQPFPLPGLGNPTIVGGSVQADNALIVSISWSQVRGNVQLKGGGGAASFSFATVGGNVQVEGRAGELEIGSTQVGGGLEVTKNSGVIELRPLVRVAGSVKIVDNILPVGIPAPGLSIHGLQTSGDLQVLNNRGGTGVVTGNIVGGTLQCFGNTHFVAWANTAGKQEGQCPFVLGTPP